MGIQSRDTVGIDTNEREKEQSWSYDRGLNT